MEQRKPKTNKELANDILCALNTNKYVFSLMDTPQTHMFKFLKYMDIAKDFNTICTRKAKTMFKQAKTEQERITILKAKCLLDENIRLFVLMDEPYTNVFAFLKYVQKASTNTAKAWDYINQLQTD